MKSIKVSIMGRQYPLRVRVEDEEMMYRIAAFVDERFKMFKKELANQNETTIMVLSCLSIAEELFNELGNGGSEPADYQQVNRVMKEMIQEIKKSNKPA